MFLDSLPRLPPQSEADSERWFEQNVFCSHRGSCCGPNAHHLFITERYLNIVRVWAPNIPNVNVRGDGGWADSAGYVYLKTLSVIYHASKARRHLHAPHTKQLKSECNTYQSSKSILYTASLSLYWSCAFKNSARRYNYNIQLCIFVYSSPSRVTAPIIPML